MPITPKSRLLETSSCPQSTWYIRVGVMQERDHDDEVVNHTPRDNVNPKHQREALQVLVEEVKTSDCRQTADIAQQHS